MDCLLIWLPRFALLKLAILRCYDHFETDQEGNVITTVTLFTLAQRKLEIVWSLGSIVAEPLLDPRLRYPAISQFFLGGVEFDDTQIPLRTIDTSNKKSYTEMPRCPDCHKKRMERLAKTRDRRFALLEKFFKSKLYHWTEARKKRGILFAMAYRKNRDSHFSCPLAQLPKEILLHILSLAHKQEGTTQHTTVTDTEFAMFLDDPERAKLWLRYHKYHALHKRLKECPLPSYQE